jgi:glycosyltransferase involved in cell wall biosynthesis
VIFAGRIPHAEVNEHVALFDLYVLPRHNLEVCRWVTPLKPYEAMASGRCVLTSDVEALVETVTDGCGATFAAGDAGALAEAIAELCGDPDRREQLGARGRQKMVEHHDEDALAAVAAAPINVIAAGAVEADA